METRLSENSPIMVQALWRSGSTYVWQKFREERNLRCYAKPFHHSLTKPAQQLALDFQKAARKFGFQHIERNYYREYGKKHNGVKKYSWKFAVQDFVLSEEDEHRDIEKYLSRLIKKAREKNKRPMLQFNRGVFRGSWLQNRFSSTSLYVVRSPQAMMQSYEKIADGSPSYYLSCYTGIVGENRDSSLFDEFADFMSIPTQGSDKWQSHLQFYMRIVRSMDGQQKKDLLGYFWCLGLLHSSLYASDCLDMDYGQDLGGEAFEEIVENETGCKLAFSDLRSKKPELEPVILSHEARRIAQSILQQSRFSDTSRLERFSLSTSTHRQLEAILG
jgi:hypothetical protein